MSPWSAVLALSLIHICVELGMFAQNPYGMGYATIVAGVRADQGLENDAFINTGYQWIDSTSIELPEYKNYLYK